MFYSLHPFTGHRVAERPALNLGEAIAVVERSAQMARVWSSTAVPERMSALRRLAEYLLQYRRQLASLAAEEMGKPLTQGLAEVDKCIRLCTYFAEKAPEWLSGRIIREPDLEASVFYQPLGVVLGVMPWNFPYWQVLRFAVPALAAGNTVLIKPAPQMLRASEALQQLLDKAFPLGAVCQHLLVDVEQLGPILDTGLVHGVALTGSDRAGASFSALAGSRLIPSVLELGGSDPMIVLPDAPLELAARTAVRARMANNGQTCIAAKRLLVHDSVSEDFVKHLIRELEILPYGPPEDIKTFFSCLARVDLARQVLDQKQEALAQGARLRWECPLHRTDETHVAPVFLDQIRPEMRVWSEEVFGPVAIMRTFKDDEEALNQANDTNYGLGASVWTSNQPKALWFAEHIQAGTIVINGLVRSDPRIPFGGIRRSGYGRELGQEGLYSFCNVKTMITDL